MKKVYAVTRGCYSDYSIVAVFSEIEKANQYIIDVPDSDYNDIETFELDPPVSDLIKRGYSLWRVLMLHDGTTEKVCKIDPDYYSVSETQHWLWERSKIFTFKIKNVSDCLRSTVWAKTEKQAIKIANERRAMMIANGEWL